MRILVRSRCLEGGALQININIRQGIKAGIFRILNDYFSGRICY